MARPNVRNTREVKGRSVDTNTNADDKKTKDCPQQVVTYIRWGNKTCPYGANTIYQGVALGSRYDYKGSATNMMYSPRDAIFYPKRQGGSVRAYGVEYRVSGFHNHASCRDMPCALCEATGRGDKIMIPSQNVCPDDWHKNIMVTSWLEIIAKKEVSCTIALMKLWSKYQVVDPVEMRIHCIQCIHIYLTIVVVLSFLV